MNNKFLLLLNRVYFNWYNYFNIYTFYVKRHNRYTKYFNTRPAFSATTAHPSVSTESPECASAAAFIELHVAYCQRCCSFFASGLLRHRCRLRLACLEACLELVTNRYFGYGVIWRNGRVQFISFIVAFLKSPKIQCFNFKFLSSGNIWPSFKLSVLPDTVWLVWSAWIVGRSARKE